MRLSDVPFNQLQCNENWLTSANGLPGRIISISTHTTGKFFETCLTIHWDGPEGIKVSLATWPDECNHITVDLSNKGLLCRPYAEDQIARLQKEIEFFKQYSKAK